MRTSEKWDAVSVVAAGAMFGFGALALAAALFGCGGAPFTLQDSPPSAEGAAPPPSAEPTAAQAEPAASAPSSGQGRVMDAPTGQVGAAQADGGGWVDGLAETSPLTVPITLGEAGEAETRVSAAAPETGAADSGSSGETGPKACAACQTTAQCASECGPVPASDPGYSWCCAGGTCLVAAFACP